MTRTGFSIQPAGPVLKRARRGDREAQAALYRLYAKPAWALARRICGCPELAAEAVQDGFVRALTRIGTWRGDASFGAWLKRIIINASISQLRARPEWVALKEESARGRQPEAEYDLARALDLLSPGDRTVIWLFDGEGYSHAEIARMTGTSPGASKSRLSRARKELRRLLDRDATPPGTHSCEVTHG